MSHLSFLSSLFLVIAAPTFLSAKDLLPAAQTVTLQNGLTAHYVPQSEVPIVSFRFEIAGGTWEDPQGKEGLSHLMAQLLGKGAGSRSAASFQEAIDFVGGTFSSQAGPRHIQMEAEFRSEDLEHGFSLLCDVLQRPNLSQQEFEKLKALTIDGVKSKRERPSAVMADYSLGWMLPAHGYGRVSGGDENSLASLTLEDVRKQAKRQLSPARTKLLVAGDFVPQVMTTLLKRHLENWQAESDPLEAVPSLPKVSGSRVLLVDKPDALQTYFRFGGLGISQGHKNYPARLLANTILGGRFTSRLNTALRIRSGLSYGAYSRFDDTHEGLFTVRSYTATKTSQEALELALKVYQDFLAKGITQEELDSARAYIQGQYAPDHVETASQIGETLLTLERNGLSKDVVNKLFERLNDLTLEQVNQAIPKMFPQENLSWVIVGQAKKLRPIVEAFGEVSETKIKGPGFAPAP